MAKTFKAPKKESPAPLGDNHFEYDGKKYRVVTPKMKLPIEGTLTALTAADVCTSSEAQEYLVKNGSACIEEVIE